MPMRPALNNAAVFSMLWGRWESLWSCSNCWEGAHHVLWLTVFSFASRTRISVSRILFGVMKSISNVLTDSIVVSLGTVGDRKNRSTVSLQICIVYMVQISSGLSLDFSSFSSVTQRKSRARPPNTPQRFPYKSLPTNVSPIIQPSMINNRWNYNLIKITTRK